MKLGILFSGGKDSCLAMQKAMKTDEVVCLISILSKNKHSYMFHTPNINMTKIQAKAIEIPLIQVETKGEKEKELNDLKSAIIEAKEKHDIEGIVTGAVESVYQATRIQKICDELEIYCFNPLWKMDQVLLLKELVREKFEVMITGIFAYPLTKTWLGKIINEETINELVKLQIKLGLSPSGEGGEIETTTLNAPFFKKKIIIEERTINSPEDHVGFYNITKTKLK